MPTSAVSFCQADEVVQERRDHAPDGLREDDVAERLAAGEPERARGRLLARMHGLDAGPVHLGDVRRVDEDERDGPQKTATSARRRSREPGAPKPSRNDTRIVGIPRKKSV